MKSMLCVLAVHNDKADPQPGGRSGGTKGMI